MTWYKIISKDKKSHNGGDFDWSKHLPVHHKDGTITKGKWTPRVDVALCNAGYHVTKDAARWLLESSIVYECEVLGDGIGDDKKSAFRSIRLVSRHNDNLSNRGHNSGYHNSGNYNSGSNNSGNNNSGYHNSGYHNSGNYNSGSNNSGSNNSGYHNSGNYNSGYCNSGNNNSGSKNSGYLNSGNNNSGSSNSGNNNSGSNNSGNNNSGSFNSKSDPREFLCAEAAGSRYYLVFGTPVLLKCQPAFPCFFHFELNGRGYKPCFVESFMMCSAMDIETLLAIPNFNYPDFFEISGISEEMIADRAKELGVKI